LVLAINNQIQLLSQGATISGGKINEAQKLMPRVHRCQYYEGIDSRVVYAEHVSKFQEEPGAEPWLYGVWKLNINVCTDDDPDRCNSMIGALPFRIGLCNVYEFKEHIKNLGFYYKIEL
jgi:hypothetical protein